LVTELRVLEIDIMFMKLSLLSKTYLKKFQWGKILFPLMSFTTKKALFSKYDVLYVNTSVILDFYVLAPFLKMKKILHVREIPASWLSKVLSPMIRTSNALVIFNSNSTQKSFNGIENGLVIHNAFEGYQYGIQPENTESDIVPLNILLIGRINTWKGQDFAIESLSTISNKNFHLKIVGSTSSGNEDLLDQLKEKVRTLGMEELVTFVSFSDEPSDLYKWADVVIIPSKKPEPFGRIAIEAMSLSKPVVAANHGGLPEIVKDGFSGFLFEPNDTKSFINSIESYLKDRRLLRQHGREAFDVFEKKFSVEKMYKELDGVFENLI